jgi:mono/diheme cytochrome c family protein
MTPTRIVTSAALVATTLVATAALAASGVQVRERDPQWVAPANAVQRANPLIHRPDAKAGGEKLYQQRCATCHGEDGRGTNKAPDLSQPAVQAQSDGELFWKVTSGNTRSDMPSFSYLPEAQRWQLVLKIRDLASR